MVDLAGLKPEARTLAFVGLFLQHWASMELALNEAVSNALGLDNLSAAIAMANIQFSNKVKVLKTAIDLNILAGDEREQLTTFCNNLLNYAATRNMVAHNGFATSEDGKGVEFFIVKASGKLHLPYEIWDGDKFREHYTKMLGFHAELKRIADKMGDVSFREARMQVDQTE